MTLPGSGVSAFFGHSGSGKTTLLRCIAGLEKTVGGELRVNGQIWQDAKTWLPTYKRPLGYVFQEASLFSHLSVLDNLRYGLKRSSSSDKINLEQAVELLGIEHLLQRKPVGLSGGERQRVAIARALALGPQILLMDEPLAALDLPRKREILPYLERLRTELNMPMLYVSHSPEEVMRLADHVVLLKDGLVVAEGELKATLARLDLPLRLGEDTGVVVEARVSERSSEWQLLRLEFTGGSLWTRDYGVSLGQSVRVRILARDVSLSCKAQPESSILNSFLGEVDSLAEDEHPSLVLVRMKVGDSYILARLTKRSAATLGVTAGERFWVQVKLAAIID